MSLSCTCDFEYEPEAGSICYWPDDGGEEFEIFKEFRGKRCCSCGELITYGNTCVRYPKRRYPHNEIEARIHGDIYFDMCDEPPIKIADDIHCEKCGEIWLNLTSIGYNCLSPSENMPKTMREYHKMVEFQKGE